MLKLLLLWLVLWTVGVSFAEAQFSADTLAPSTDSVATMDTSTVIGTAITGVGSFGGKEELKPKKKKKKEILPDLEHPSEAERCGFAFDRTDEFTGRRTRGLAAQPFFSYTPKPYRKFLKEKEYLSCHGFLAKSNNLMTLNLVIEVANNTAKEQFGELKPNSSIGIQPLSDKPIYLLTHTGAKGEVQDGKTIYRCAFVLTPKDIKKLSKSEIDKVRLRWSKGYQIYEVFYLDFLIDQFACFEAKKKAVKLKE